MTYTGGKSLFLIFDCFGPIRRGHFVQKSCACALLIKRSRARGEEKTRDGIGLIFYYPNVFQSVRYSLLSLILDRKLRVSLPCIVRRIARTDSPNLDAQVKKNLSTSGQNYSTGQSELLKTFIVMRAAQVIITVPMHPA